MMEMIITMVKIIQTITQIMFILNSSIDPASTIAKREDSLIALSGLRFLYCYIYIGLVIHNISA